MSRRNGLLGPAMYAAAFCVALPVGLTLWARRLEPVIGLPAFHWPGVGTTLLATGVLLWGWGVWSLWVFARGLPMNAYPPSKLVTHGAFAWVNHPIYVAFVLACAGVSLITGSAAGLWVVTPLTTLGCAALVWGYEDRALMARFGGARRRPRLVLPAREDRPPTPLERMSVYALVFLPWLVIYEAIGHAPVERPLSVHLPGEAHWPVVTWAELPYFSTYLFVAAVPMLLRHAAALRRFAIGGLIATAVVSLVYMAVPVVSPPRPFVGDGPLAALLRWEQADGLDGRAAFPAFHVVWAMLAARAYASCGQLPAVLGWMWAVVIASSCMLTGMHAAMDVAAAVVVFPLIVRADRVYDCLRRACEHLANGWREWRIGPVRVINYAVFAGVGAFVGCLLIGSLGGATAEVDVVVVSVLALIGAAAWGQYWVGSATTLLRPFGYFGSVLGAGVALAGIAAWRGAGPFWLLLGAATIAAPWVQAIGRLRCLINGCCHGAPCAAELGIVCTHARSRVVRLSGLAGQSIHPTPLYSILSNVVIGLLLLRLYRAEVSPPLIAGFYLLLAGLSRFVEESLRGEPHTPTYAGLRLYQWCAVAMVGTGMMVCTLRTGVVLGPAQASPAVWATAAAVALVYAFAMGADFPDSTRRFSRLT